MGILKPKGGNKKQIAVRLDAAVVDILEAVEKRIEQEAPGDVLDRADIIEPAIRAAVKSANAELDARKKNAASANAAE